MRKFSHRSTSLVDVLDRVLDKGIVIDATVRVSVIGIDLLGVDAKITVASIETYMQLSEDPRAYELGLVAGEAPPQPLEKTGVLTAGEPGEPVEAGPSLAEPPGVAEPESPPEIAANGDASAEQEMS